MASSVADAHTKGRPERCISSMMASATTLWNSPAKARTCFPSSLSTAVPPASGRPDVSSNRSASGLPSTPPISLSCFTAKAIPSSSSRPAQGMPGNDKGPRPPMRIIFSVSISLPSDRVLWLRTNFAPTDVGQEASSPLHVPPIGVTKSGKQECFLLSRSDDDEDEEECAACKDEPVGGRERVGSYQQGERHVEGGADAAIR